MTSSEDKNKHFDPSDANLDPISGQPGAHPVGTGIGAAGAGSVGAVVGAVLGGPIGAVVGSAIGAVAGGLAGKNAAEQINPTVEDEYWRENYTSRPYVEADKTYDDYQPAYKTGYESYGQYASSNKNFNDVEPEIKSRYQKDYKDSALPWDKAKPAVQDAWSRAQDSIKLYEERLIADKTREKTGEVAVGKRVETETARVSVPLEKERVVIERTTPTDTTAVTPGSVNFGDSEVARVDVYGEVADIHKEAFVREEVKVKKVVETETATAEEQLRREEIDIKNDGKSVVNNPKRP